MANEMPLHALTCMNINLVSVSKEWKNMERGEDTKKKLYVIIKADKTQSN